MVHGEALATQHMVETRAGTVLHAPKPLNEHPEMMGWQCRAVVNSTVTYID